MLSRPKADALAFSIKGLSRKELYLTPFTQTTEDVDEIRRFLRPMLAARAPERGTRLVILDAEERYAYRAFFHSMGSNGRIRVTTTNPDKKEFERLKIEKCFVVDRCEPESDTDDGEEEGCAEEDSNLASLIRAANIVVIKQEFKQEVHDFSYLLDYADYADFMKFAEAEETSNKKLKCFN